MQCSEIEEIGFAGSNESLLRSPRINRETFDCPVTPGGSLAFLLRRGCQFL